MPPVLHSFLLLLHIGIVVVFFWYSKPEGAFLMSLWPFTSALALLGLGRIYMRTAAILFNGIALVVGGGLVASIGLLQGGRFGLVILVTLIIVPVITIFALLRSGDDRKPEN